jgi:hypothetical protein
VNPADHEDHEDRLTDGVYVEPLHSGDVYALPWPPTTDHYTRVDRIAATVPLADTGCALTPGPTYHALIPDAPHDRGLVHFAYVNQGNTIGTLVVDPDAHARLTHPDHPDLLIGTCVYVIHHQPAPRTTPRPRRTETAQEA